MLDRLPPELLHAVFDHLPTATLGVFAPRPPYREATATLLSCSLVSHRVSARARRVLWRDVRLERPPAQSKLLALVNEDAVKELRASTRTLCIQVLRPDGEEEDEAEDEPERVAEQVSSLLGHFPNVKELRVEMAGELELADLQKCLPCAFTSSIFLPPSLIPLPADLAILQLSRLKLRELSTPVQFPHLASLTLDRVTVPLSTLPALLSADALPSLRALAFAGHDDYDPPNPEIFAVLGQCDLTRLELLQLVGEDQPSFPPSLFDSSLPTFLTVDSADELAYASQILHLRFYAEPAEDSTETASRIQSVGEFVNTEGRETLRSVHLPLSMYSDVAPEEPIWVPLMLLETYCNVGGVKYAAYDAEEEDPYTVSPTLWRFAKRVKAERSEGKGE